MNKDKFSTFGLWLVIILILIVLYVIPARAESITTQLQFVETRLIDENDELVENNVYFMNCSSEDKDKFIKIEVNWNSGMTEIREHKYCGAFIYIRNAQLSFAQYISSSDVVTTGDYTEYRTFIPILVKG